MKAPSHRVSLVHQQLHPRSKLGPKLCTSQVLVGHPVGLQLCAHGAQQLMPSARSARVASALHQWRWRLICEDRVNCPSNCLSSAALVLDIHHRTAHMPKIWFVNMPKIWFVSVLHDKFDHAATLISQKIGSTVLHLYHLEMVSQLILHLEILDEFAPLSNISLNLLCPSQS